MVRLPPLPLPSPVAPLTPTPTHSFADRQFYDDWWNSTSWDEFSRKWNRPVHTFLLRHVYASSMSSYHLTRQGAMFVTFLLSAAAHELVMAIVTKKIRMYLFTLQVRVCACLGVWEFGSSFGRLADV